MNIIRPHFLLPQRRSYARRSVQDLARRLGFDPITAAKHRNFRFPNR